MNADELKKLLVEVIREEFTAMPCELSKRWAGGKIVLQPDNDTQAKEVPLEVFFRKLTGVREALRVLEQKINGQDGISLEEKANLQGYITKCYGSLTTFNILFKEEKDKFVGAGAKANEPPEKPALSLADAKKKLGLNEWGKS